jgi:hypothetical protein
MGAWRSSLKSLRSCIENVLFAMYYKDHPVELRLWDQGAHRLGFAESVSYFERHPDLTKVTNRGLDVLSHEYAVLSRAVHASAQSFRMTSDGKTLLWSGEKSRLGAWATREAAVIKGINLFLIALFRAELQGARKPNLRQAIAFAVPATLFPKVKAEHSVVLSPVI